MSSARCQLERCDCAFFLHRITCSRDRSPFWRALPTSRSESSAETSAFLGLLGAGFTHISTYLQIYIYARVTLTLLDLLFQILLKTKLYLLETTFCILLLGHKYPQTIMFFWPLSLSLSCQADHRFDAAHCVPCGPNMKNCRDWRCFSSLNYPSIASMPTHFDTLLDSTKTKLSKSFYSTSTGCGLKLIDFNIPNGSLWSCTAQLCLAILGAASRRWKEISNIPMLDSQPWQITTFNFYRVSSDDFGVLLRFSWRQLS